MTRSGCSCLIAAARTRAVSNASAPASAPSDTSTPRSAPMESPFRIASLARSGPIETRITSPPCASLSCRPSSTPHSSPGSRTASLSREMVLSPSSVRFELGSGTCLTVTTIFNGLRSLSLRRKTGMEALEVAWRVEAFELGGLEVLEPRHVQVHDHVVRGVVAGVERADNRGQRGLAIGPAHRLEQAVVARDGGIGAVRRRDRQLRG